MLEDGFQFAQCEGRFAEFLRGERFHDGLGDHRVFHDDGLQIRAECRLDCGDIFGGHFDELRERSVDGGFEKVGVVEPAKDGLRAFAETFAACVELQQHVEA